MYKELMVVVIFLLKYAYINPTYSLAVQLTIQILIMYNHIKYVCINMNMIIINIRETWNKTYFTPLWKIKSL